MGTGILQRWESNRLAVEEVWRSPHSKITIGVSLAQSLEKERCIIYMIEYFTLLFYLFITPLLMTMGRPYYVFHDSIQW